MTMIVYRDLLSLEDLQACVELQARVWQFEPVDVVPVPILLITAKYGGFLHGAFDGERLVGFVYSLPARGHTRWFQWSHMLAVDPAYQGQGIGAELKFRQRAYARDHGFDFVAWTYDPLEVRNAYFNFEKLGVIARFYEPNVYGITTSRLHWQLPTDRLVAEWWVHLDRRTFWPGEETLTYPRLIAVRWQQDRPWPGDIPPTPWPDVFLVPVPVPQLYPESYEEARAYRSQWLNVLRDVMTRAFGAGYVAIRFVREVPEIRMSAYLLVHERLLDQPIPSW